MRAVQGPEFADVRQYGGEQLLTGPQAEAYANDFIAVHLEDVAGGAVVSLAGGGVLVLLSVLGFRHSRRLRGDLERPAELDRSSAPVESKAA